jgi:hypothetical protein
MPFADQGGVVADLAQRVGQGRHGGIEPTPGIGGVRANDTGHTHPIRIPSGEQGGARGRADRAIGAHGGEEHPFGGEAVEMRGPQIRLSVGGNIAVTVVVGQDQQEVGTLSGGGRHGDSEQDE